MYYEDFIGAEFCKEIQLTDGCKYIVSSYEMNSLLLHMIRVWISKNTEGPVKIGNYLKFYKTLSTQLAGTSENKITFYSSLVYYRSLIHDSIVQAMEKSKFRDLKRIYITETKPERRVSQQWAMAMKRTYYEGIKIVEREIGKIQLYELFSL